MSSIPVERYTHLLYSFANMTSEGTVFLSDPWADTQVSLGRVLPPARELA